MSRWRFNLFSHRKQLRHVNMMMMMYKSIQAHVRAMLGGGVLDGCCVIHPSTHIKPKRTIKLSRSGNTTTTIKPIKTGWSDNDTLSPLKQSHHMFRYFKNCPPTFRPLLIETCNFKYHDRALLTYFSYFPHSPRALVCVSLAKVACVFFLLHDVVCCCCFSNSPGSSLDSSRSKPSNSTRETTPSDCAVRWMNYFTSFSVNLLLRQRSADNIKHKSIQR